MIPRNAFKSKAVIFAGYDLRIEGPRLAKFPITKTARRQSCSQSWPQFRCTHKPGTWCRACSTPHGHNAMSKRKKHERKLLTDSEVKAAWEKWASVSAKPPRGVRLHVWQQLHNCDAGFVELAASYDDLRVDERTLFCKNLDFEARVKFIPDAIAAAENTLPDSKNPTGPKPYSQPQMLVCVALRLYPLFARSHEQEAPKVIVIDPRISFGRAVLAGDRSPNQPR